MWKKKREEIRAISRDDKYMAIEGPADNQLGPHFYSKNAHPFPDDCPVQLLKLQSAILLSFFTLRYWTVAPNSKSKRLKINDVKYFRFVL